MMKETDLYILDWANEAPGMIGIFRGSDLSQVDNGSKSMFYGNLKRVVSLYDPDESGLKLHYLNSYNDLKELREARGLEQNPSLDEYLNSLLDKVI